MKMTSNKKIQENKPGLELNFTLKWTHSKNFFDIFLYHRALQDLWKNKKKCDILPLIIPDVLKSFQLLFPNSFFIFHLMPPLSFSCTPTLADENWHICIYMHRHHHHHCIYSKASKKLAESYFQPPKNDGKDDNIKFHYVSYWYKYFSTRS